MRYKGIISGLTRTNRGVFNTFGFSVRTYASALQNPPFLDISKEFDADDGTICKAISNDYTKTRDNNLAFKNALISTRYTDITIPAGRYYFSEPITMINGTPVLIPKKIIRGSATPIRLSFPKVGYDLTLNCPSTILDFSLLGTNTANTLITIRGNHQTPMTGTGPMSRGTHEMNLTSNKGIKSGDILALTNPNDASYGARLDARNGELISVTGIVSDSANNIYTKPLMGHYPELPMRPMPQTVHSGKIPHIPQKLYSIAKLNPLSIIIQNITIVDDRPKIHSHPNEDRGTINGASIGLKLVQCVDSQINNVYVIDASHHTALSLNNCMNLQINSGNYVLGIPDNSRILPPKDKNGSIIDGYSSYFQVDGYGIMIGDSQDITINGTSVSAWTHSITSGGGGEIKMGDNGAQGIFWIVNRNLMVKHCTITNTPATIYYYENGQRTTSTALTKRGAANFHVNTEDSTYMYNTLHGSGFNICGHNITLDSNTINTNNRDEALRRYLSHDGDSAFYFNETKSGQFKIINNKVLISGFYQNPQDNTHEDKDKDELRFGEFLTFNLDGIFGRSDSTPYEYWLSEVYYPTVRLPYHGVLEISNNLVQITCSGNEDQSTRFSTGLIMIGGISIDKYLDKYIDAGNPNCQYATKEAQAAKDAIRQFDVDVKITGNTFLIFSNPKNSTAKVLINPQRQDPKITPLNNGNYSRIRNVEMVGNKFCGNFRFSINKSRLFGGATSDLVKIRDNQFWSDLSDVQVHITENVEKTKKPPEIDNNPTLPYSESCLEGRGEEEISITTNFNQSTSKA